MVLDTTKPTVALTSITSSNPNPTLAKVGDTVTLLFTADADLRLEIRDRQQPTATLQGKPTTMAVQTNHTNGMAWNATYVIAPGDTEGDLAIVVNQGYTDLTGNRGDAVKLTPTPKVQLGSSNVAVDTTKPIVTLTRIFSSNGNPVLAMAGDNVTLLFSSDEDLRSTLPARQLPTAALEGKAMAMSRQDGDTRGTAWKATSLIAAGQEEGNQVVRVDLGFTDLTGNPGNEVRETTASGAQLGVFLCGDVRQVRSDDRLDAVCNGTIVPMSSYPHFNSL